MLLIIEEGICIFNMYEMSAFVTEALNKTEGLR